MVTKYPFSLTTSSMFICFPRCSNYKTSKSLILTTLSGFWYLNFQNYFHFAKAFTALRNRLSLNSTLVYCEKKTMTTVCTLALLLHPAWSLLEIQSIVVARSLLLCNLKGLCGTFWLRSLENTTGLLLWL